MDRYKELRQMDWEVYTADFFNEQTKTFVHVLNHFLSDGDSVDRTIRFMIGRVRWLNAYFHAASLHHRFVVDDVGRNVRPRHRKKIRKSLSKYAESVEFVSER